MILVLDVGNTNITIGIFDRGQLRCHWRLTSKIARTEDETWLLIKVLCDSERIGISEIEGLALGSVVPAVSTVIRRMVEKRMQVNFIEISSKIDTGLVIQYENPAAVGADRICNAVAGFRKYGGPLVIVDFGTATTFDVVSEEAEYVGGIIAPGLESAVESLHRAAAKLPAVDLKFPPSLIGKNTEASIQAGLMYGGAEMVEGLIRRLKAELGEHTKVIATGGLASTLVHELPSVDKVEPDLTLEGLYDIYLRNIPQK
ncbi:MAG: type III pantothenate kinase [candidate division KSB1 bacterium]|nr:type III pantothenate kinase [candidate division KSB1 bacterium]MDQ7066343.1 type III pantothenate kinase [candidate division KSB1 bacterium]